VFIRLFYKALQISEQKNHCDLKTFGQPGTNCLVHFVANDLHEKKKKHPGEGELFYEIIDFKIHTQGKNIRSLQGNFTFAF